MLTAQKHNAGKIRTCFLCLHDMKTYICLKRKSLSCRVSCCDERFGVSQIRFILNMECWTMFGLKWLWEDSKTLKCHLFYKGPESKNNDESLRCEAFTSLCLLPLISSCVLINSVYNEADESDETDRADCWDWGLLSSTAGTSFRANLLFSVL